MAGLLDSVFGDAETKDEFGQTERDRRQPIWSGLMKAGLLAYAGGGNLMPEDRAKYYAEAGGALAGIPNDMLSAASSNAQQKLRGQQLAEGTRKIADRDKVRALAQSPEIQEALKNAKGADRISIQAAIDTGDLAALNTAVGNLDKVGLRTQQLDLATQKLDLARQKAAQGVGSYKGTGEVAQHLNNLKDAPFDSFEYWAAHQFFQTERTLTDGTKIGKMNLEGLPAPTFQGRAGSQPVVTGGEKTPDQLAQELKPGEERTLPTGVTISKDQNNVIEWDVPGVGDRDGSRYRQAPGGQRQTLPALKPIATPELSLLTTTTSTLKDLDELEKEMKKPNVQLGDISTYLLNNNALNLTNPEGVRARAIIGALAAKKVHDLSGAAVSDAEFKRLEAFIPKNTDNPDIVRKKLVGLKRELEDVGRAHYYNIPAGSRISPELRARFGKSQQTPPAGGGGGLVLGADGVYRPAP